jgi:hypothetical protein
VVGSPPPGREAAAVRILLVLTAALALAAPAAAATTALSPNPARFGDVVTATLVAPAGAEVQAEFGPYAPVVPPKRSSTTITYRLQCLNEGCVPPKTVHFPPARVDGARVAWPAFRVVGRVPDSALAKSPPGWREQKAFAAPSYRIRPGLLAALLVAAAALLAAGAVALVTVELRRRRRLEEQRIADARPPLERALALLRESERRPAPDRRKALALVSRELPPDDALQETATALAWRRGDPGAKPIDELADALEEELDR